MPDQPRGVEEPGQVLWPQAPGQTESESQTWRGISWRESQTRRRTSWRQPQCLGGGLAGVFDFRNLGER